MSSSLSRLRAIVKWNTISTVSVACFLIIEVDAQSWTSRVAAALALATAVLSSSQRQRSVALLSSIAGGDRFVAFPMNWLESANCRKIAEAGETMRSDLIAADAAIADHKRMFAEARSHRESATFFTNRFHESVAEAFEQFSDKGEEICATVENLNTHNASLLKDVLVVSNAVSGATTDVNAVSLAAKEVSNVVARTSGQIAQSESATRSTLTDLLRARDTIERLKRSGQEISAIIAIIRSVASQTSLLALNATIEAARAGEAGRGFAVVASEVKQLATKTEQATGTIRSQIEAIQSAVEDTSSAIDAVMSHVGSMTDAHRAFTGSLALGTLEIERIGTNATSIATRVTDAMPDLATGIGEIEAAGRSVLHNARSLMTRSETLVAGFRGYFEDLASGAIKVGVLHSLSGTVTAAERPLQEMLIGLIEQTNKSGGLLGRPLEAHIVNPHGDARAYGDGAEHLLAKGAAVIFGGWTSHSRMEIRPVVERRDSLLFYPSQYEGDEGSPNIVYVGGTPAQQAKPAIDFLKRLGRRNLILIGGQSPYSLGTHAAIKRFAPKAGMTVMLDLAVPVAHNAWSNIVGEIVRAERRGHVAIMSTLNADATVLFFRELARRGITSGRIPTMCLSIGEREMPSLDYRTVAGNYVAWNYLHRLDTADNDRFIAQWRGMIGDPSATANDALEATWIGFSIWKAAVLAAGSADASAVRSKLRGMTIRAPSGFDVLIDNGQHAHRPAMIGEIRSDGSIAPVWIGDRVLRPDDTDAVVQQAHPAVAMAS
ncbi:transporter substrate-binding protein [Beijerinckia sp. L45]|uniref:transporter substrate-binding protein n=1 Tax=Beijerinckia sp. L45 TaxID=1641855 RepID=UPI00131C726F|nr:transporter substrate-binding protein [Beijerinckia sp. L45]